jgi:hypothetical protein
MLRTVPKVWAEGKPELVVITHKFLRAIRNLKARAFRRESFDRLRTGFANSHGFLKPIRENS